MRRVVPFFAAIVAAGLASAAVGLEGGRMTTFGGEQREPVARPLLMTLAPYGDPFALAPSGLRWDWPGGDPATGLLLGHGMPAMAEKRAPLGIDNREGAPAATRVAGVDDPDLPAAPGSFKRTPTIIPGYVDPTAPPRPRVVAPRVNPDIEVPLSRRTTLGVFGEVQRVEVERSGAVPNVRAHGVGAGLSLEYKFGD